jgi:INO80 complex subunit Ies4
LGPKANQGAINAGLRALDRSGAACRKWNKRGFSVKSFTGIVWELPSWTAPKREAKDEPDENGDGKENGDGQLVPSSSNVGSETSRQNANEANDATDSPAPVNLISATA